MASRIYFGIKDMAHLLKLSNKEIRKATKTDKNWSSVIIAKGNIIEGIEAKE